VAVAKAEAAGPLELGTGDAPSRTPSAPIAVQGAGTVQTFGELGKAGGTSAPSAAPIDPATSNPTPGLDDRVSPEDIGRLNESIAAAQGDAGSQGSASSDTVGSASAASQTPAQADGTGPGYERTAPAASVSSPFEDMRAESARLAPPALTGLTDGHLPASRISISSIGLDSKVKELEIVVREDSLAWETPKHVAGHIPTTALPGERGQGWYFGHLESPIRGEGNVFRRLPEIPGLLRSGEPVYILLEAAERQYRYRVYKTELVHQDDLRITNSGDQDITLVTCFPTLVYDHRLLVTAALIGVVES
jgi:LPXTG-site transpeptidase (sortase) family protein